MSELRLHLLGGLYLTRAGRIVEGPAAKRKPLALLAMLAVSGTAGMSRDRIAGFLWCESSDDQAKRGLKQQVHLIRKQMAIPGLITGVETLRLNPAAVSCDLWDLHRAIEELQVENVMRYFGGPLLNGIMLDDNHAFQSWVDSEQARLVNQVQSRFRKHVLSLESSGDHLGAVEVWAALVELEPLSDRNEVGLVRALVRSGDRAAAECRVRAYRALIRREFEAELSPEVEQSFKEALGAQHRYSCRRERALPMFTTESS